MAYSNAGRHLCGLAYTAGSEAIKKELRRSIDGFAKHGLTDLNWYPAGYDDQADLEATVCAHTAEALQTFGRLVAHYGDGTYGWVVDDFEAVIRFGDLTVRLSTTFARYLGGEAERIVRDAIAKHGQHRKARP
ncbi:hypothetical protein [Glycomyces salinus]|uniref:hypothetical protein n=1 Tax=Glycomyces salinus TaxID=980294 RepID=UPI0018EC2968|nr:hypothetical protein [Glycomyces salinus]